MYSDPTFAVAVWGNYRSSRADSNAELAAMYLAADLYERKGRRGLFSRIWSALRRRAARLPALAARAGMLADANRYFAGTMTVPIKQISGSENGVSDYDRDFRPLRATGRGRWLSVAAARLQGLALPPVELIEVEGAYYVRDGHNRVSVARALGEEFIEASVTVWKPATA